MWLYPFFELSSVSTAYGGNFLGNPAALGYGRREISLMLTDSLFVGSLSFKGMGVAYWTTPSRSKLFLSYGLGFGGLYVGSSYDPFSSTFQLGGLLRPRRFISLGFTFEGKGGKVDSTYVGIALRPKSHLILYMDVHYLKLSLENPGPKAFLGDRTSLGAYIYLSPYIGLKGEYALLNGLTDRRVSIGLELNLGKLKLGGAMTRKSFGVGLMVSDRPFTPSLKSGRYEAKVSSYTEDGRKGMFGRGKRFYDFLKNLKEAVESPKVKVIALDLRDFGLNLAQAEEVRNLLKKAKSKGKEVLFYSNYYGLGSYYLASVGKVFVAPEGMLSFPGVSAELTFFKRTFDSLGIEVQEFRVGKYKSALEPFVRDTMSQANREQYRRMVDVVWGVWLKDVAEGRDMDADSLNSLVKAKLGLFLAKEAREYGLVDSLIYEDQWKELLKEKGKEVRLVKVQNRAWKMDRGKVAIVVAEGGIVLGESSYNPIPLIGGKNVGDRTLVKVLNKLRKDKSIKAVVLRVNSPGGSALASDNIARAVELLAKEKPVIVSMGRVAASGGYYISALADTILVDRLTITGSIGVIGAKFVLGKFYREKLHLNRDVVKTYPFSDAWSLWRKMDSNEVRRITESIGKTYDRFVSVVSKGRDIPEDSVRVIGGGRVWMGYDAVEIGLADGFGGLLDAVRMAAEKANLEEYDVVLYPKSKSMIDRLKGLGKETSLHLEDYIDGDFQILYRMEYDIRIR
ncbi:MAG: signal peptide peptidase SppA [Thermotogae bacterium]|nr:signal peptide peptidase SppA [Thermotogota bacterium]